jgi:hypothetical protein
MPGTYTIVLENDNVLEVGDEEDVRDDESSEKDTKYNTTGASSAKVFKARRPRGLDSDEKREDNRSEGEVEWDIF